MKVLFVNSLNPFGFAGGAERSLAILAKQFSANSVDVVIVCLSNFQRVEYFGNIKIYHIKCRNLCDTADVPKLSFGVKLIWHTLDSFNPLIHSQFKRILLREKPNILHTNNIAGFSPYIWILAKKLNVPIVHTLRDYYLLCPRRTMFNHDKNCSSQCWRCKAFTISKKMLSKYVDAVVGVSPFILQKHIDVGYFPNAQIRTAIYNPIEAVKPSMPTSRKLSVKFAFVGSIIKEKGIELLLESFKSFDNELLIFGKPKNPDYLNYLKSKYPESNIKFLGTRNPEEIFNCYDVLIVPSLWHEPFGRVVAESLSYGKPVIVSNRGALSSLIDIGKTGFVFSPERKNDLTDKVRWFIDNPGQASNLFSNCLKASSQFAAVKIALEYLGLYKLLSR